MTERRSNEGAIIAIVIGILIIAAGAYAFGMPSERHQARSVLAPLLGLAGMAIGAMIASLGIFKLLRGSPSAENAENAKRRR